MLYQTIANNNVKTADTGRDKIDLKYETQEEISTIINPSVAAV